MTIRDNLYQVWITSYPLDGADPASQYDKGYELKKTFPTIEEAVNYQDKIKDYAPVITKLVTWQTQITDITDATPNSRSTKE